MSGFKINPDERRQLQQWQTNLRSQVSCGANDAREKAVELAKLTAGFPLQGMDDVSSDLRIEMFFEALEGLPASAVRAARLNIVAGKTAYGRPFGPGPIEFADLVRSVVKPAMDDLRDIDTILSAPTMDDEISEDERERVKVGFAKWQTEQRLVKTAHDIYEDVMSGLEKRARDNGVDFKTAMDAIADADPKKTGTFGKLPTPPR